MKTSDDSSLLRELNQTRFAAQTRRHFLRDCTTGLGAMFLGSLGSQVFGAQKLDFTRDAASPLAALPPQFTAKARRVIYLHMAGAPSQLELFDYKPDLQRLDGLDCPPSFLEGKRFAFISGVPKMLGGQFPFHQAGRSGTWIVLLGAWATTRPARMTTTRTVTTVAVRGGTHVIR